jgi:polyphenol oxidase
VSGPGSNTEQMFYKDTRHVYRVEPLDRLPWLDHGFGTCASDGWIPGPLAWVRQIHSDKWIEAKGEAGCLGEADCLISAVPSLYVGIRTADCIPLVIVDECRRAVAAVHAGWRGSAEAIAVKAVRAMGERFGSRPADLLAAVGPGICGRCYEVGAEVAARFKGLFPERDDLDTQTRIDLPEANRRQFLQAGLEPVRIFVSGLCTACSTAEFHSWRRDKDRAGRMVSAVGIRD